MGGGKRLRAIAMATGNLCLMHPNAAKNHTGCFTKTGLGQESAVCVTVFQGNRRTSTDANNKTCI